VVLPVNSLTLWIEFFFYHFSCYIPFLSLCPAGPMLLFLSSLWSVKVLSFLENFSPASPVRRPTSNLTRCTPFYFLCCLFPPPLACMTRVGSAALLLFPGWPPFCDFRRIRHLSLLVPPFDFFRIFSFSSLIPVIFPPHIDFCVAFGFSLPSLFFERLSLFSAGKGSPPRAPFSGLFAFHVRLISRTHFFLLPCLPTMRRCKFFCRSTFIWCRRSVAFSLAATAPASFIFIVSLSVPPNCQSTRFSPLSIFFSTALCFPFPFSQALQRNLHARFSRSVLVPPSALPDLVSFLAPFLAQPD